MTYSPVTLESLLTHQTWALRVARRLVREEGEAEDLVQRTWMAALRSPPQSQVGAKAWIRKVILNLARERHRRRQARVQHEGASSAADASATTGDAFESVSRAEIHRLLSERLMHLAEPYRTVVLQRFYEDLTSVEIAQRLGIPAGTVRWRLKIGLDHLREELDRRSRGDRSRWVSALLLFACPSGPRRTGEQDEATLPRSSAVSTSVLSWTVLGASGLLGFFLLRAVLDTPSEVEAAAPISARDPGALGRDGARIQTSEPGQRAPASAAPREPVSPVPPRTEARGLALLVLTPEREPVPNAAILVARSDGHELRTHSDAEGRAWVEPHPGDVGSLGLEATRGRLSVRALAAGRVASELVHVAPPFSPEHEVHLTVGGPERVLEGRVLAPEGRPVAGATVAWFVPRGQLELRPEGEFSSTAYLSVRSGADGEFRLANLSGKGEVIACFAPGFALYSRNCDTIDGGPFDIVLDRGATLVGTIRRPGGSPAADLPISLESICKTEEWATGLPGYDAHRQGFYERTRSDAQGRFRLEGVCAGGRLRTLWALDEEHGLMATATFRLENGAEVEWDGELTAAPRLDLRLVDEHRQPLSGMLVNLRRQLTESWWARRLHTDDQGRVRVLDCPPGPIVFDLFPPLGEGPSLGWRMLEPSPEEQTLVIDSRRRVTVRGRVLDPSGAPETRGELVALSLDTGLETSIPRTLDGGFRQRLPAGAYMLILRVDQTAGKLAEARCRAGTETDLGELVTPHLGDLRLEARAGEDGARASYSVFRVSDEGEPEGSLLVAQGWLQESMTLAMFPGRYRVLLHAGRAGRAVSHLVRVRPCEETLLEGWRR